jgi:hypothetical protein
VTVQSSCTSFPQLYDINGTCPHKAHKTLIVRKEETNGERARWCGIPCYSHAARIKSRILAYTIYI